MSAEAQVAATAAPADAGPQIITVMGQDGHVDQPEVKADKPAEAPAAKVAGSEEQHDDENHDDKGRAKPGVQTRIDELTRARREAEREAEYWKTRAQGTAAAPAKAAEANQPPVRANYESEEAYIDALTDHKVDQKMAQREQKQAQVQAQTSAAESWQQRLDKARTEIEGFDSVMENADAPVAGHVAELIMEHDHGPKVMHHLAQHPEQLDKINSMSPAKAAFEIGRLASQFDVSASSSKPAAAEQVSKAPPPAARSVGSGRSTETALGDLPMEDYIAKRKSQGASWAR